MPEREPHLPGFCAEHGGLMWSNAMRAARVASVRKWRDDTRHLFGPDGIHRHPTAPHTNPACVQWDDADVLLAEIDRLRGEIDPDYHQ